MATPVPDVGNTATSTVFVGPEGPPGPTPQPEPVVTPTVVPPAGPEVNLVTIIGGLLVVIGGLTYASAEMALTTLVGATDPLSYGWIFDLYGVAFLLIGFGLLVAFKGLNEGWPVIGGWVAVFGSVLISAGWFLYAAERGNASIQDLLWTNRLDAFGFFFLALGIMLGFGGLAIIRPRTVPGFFTRVRSR